MHDSAQRLRVLGAGVFGLLLSVGVARFAYTPLLPVMQQQAGLGVSLGGWLAAINYAGYLSGALIALMVGKLATKDRLYRAGMVLAVATTVMMALGTHPLLWAASRYLAGLSSAAGMLLGSALALNWLMRHGYRSELGLLFGGLGLGIAGAAALAWVLAPWLDWRGQWLAFAGVGVLLLVPALRWLPPPDTTGLTTAGEPMPDRPPGALYLRLFMAAYFCAGVAYVISATFIVDIVDKLPGLAGRGNLAFLVIGLAAAPACIAWDLVARRTGDLNALLLAALLQIVGLLLPVFPGGLAMTLLGAALFGGTFVGMVSLVLTIAGRYYPTRPAKMMGKMTLSYGSAQILAPAVTATLAARSGSYQDGLSLAAGMLSLGVVLLLALKAVERRGPAAPA